MTGKLSDEEEERYALAVERLNGVAGEHLTEERYQKYFSHEAAFLLEMEKLRYQVLTGKLRSASLEELQKINADVYREILPEHYDTCYGNPVYAAGLFGRDMGILLSFLYMELRGAAVYAVENKQWDMLIGMELLLACYSQFEEGIPKAADVQKTLYFYAYDYCQDFMNDRTREVLDPSLSFARDIIMEEDLSDLRYLYRFGEYVTDNELRTAAFLNSLPQEEIDSIARTWTEGYRIGFAAGRKDISKKKTVNIRYRLGFERVVRAAVLQFRGMGLESVIHRSALHAVNKVQHLRIGYYGAIPNRQFEYDHKNDAAVFLDEAFVTNKLTALRISYEHCRQLAADLGGPAVMDVFGEVPFTPVSHPEAAVLSPEQERNQVHYNSEAGQITNRFIRGSERSFTIIAYPVPEIGDRFEDIFRETVKINNLDYRKYQRIQQKLIDALDQGVRVHVKGMNGNRTDITVQLHHLEDPSKQTIFENCVADVNIPVGEVFTSPVLKGTSGVLHVSRVYLEEFQYRDLTIAVRDGMVSDYSCANFDREEDNRRYIEENILFHHPTVPVGEFAIGTNTAAYRMAHTYHIADKLPILIAEKMGPHFAFGDTCYSYQEDTAVYNPDGKEIVARDNERSILRKTDPSKAYFGCHTDITIPYEELGFIRVIRRDGSEISLIENGRFVLPGTEELNEPLEGLC